MKREKKKHENGVPEGYFGMRDLRELLGKSKTTINNMIRDGRLPEPFKDGKLRIWKKLTIQRWMENAKFTQ